MIIKTILFINKLISNKKNIINDLIIEEDYIKIIFKNNIFDNIINIINIIKWKEKNIWMKDDILISN